MVKAVKRICINCNKNKPNPSGWNGPNDQSCKVCKKQRVTRNRRAQHYRETFDITLDEYYMLHQERDGKCWICDGTRKWLDVDHDHKKEKEGTPIRQTIRGLLCARCNRQLLAAARDSAEMLRRAADYLESDEAQVALGEQW